MRKNVQKLHPHQGWSGGAMMLGKRPVPGRPTGWITVGQGPTALAVGAGGCCLDILLPSILFLLFLPLFWMVDGCSGFNGPLRQYFSLYRAVSQREGERGEKKIDESKNVQTTPTRTYYKRSRPLPYCNPNCRTPRHCKFTQHHRTTRPPPSLLETA